jgi:hypothetical protein
MTLHDTVGSHASVSVLFGVSADGMPKSETGVSSLPLRIVGTVSDIAAVSVTAIVAEAASRKVAATTKKSALGRSGGRIGHVGFPVTEISDVPVISKPCYRPCTTTCSPVRACRKLCGPYALQHCERHSVAQFWVIFRNF